MFPIRLCCSQRSANLTAEVLSVTAALFQRHGVDMSSGILSVRLRASLSLNPSARASRRIQPFNYSWSRAILRACVRPARQAAETFGASLRSESITVQRCREAVAALTLHVYAGRSQSSARVLKCRNACLIKRTCQSQRCQQM